MRRWELVADGSAKFWEIGQDGATVTVRFGRLGTAGQTQTKELASAEAADAHVTKLVAEKEKKGYRPEGAAAEPQQPAATEPTAAQLATTTPGAPQPSARQHATTTPGAQPSAQQPAAQPLAAAPPTPPKPATQRPATEPAATTPTAPLDEDTWVIPKAWLRDAVRQREFDPAPEFAIDPAKAEQARQQITEQAEAIENGLTAKGSKAELVSAAREHLAGQPTPIGAAAIAAITKPGVPAVHAWIADHGLAFATKAVVELMGLTFSDEWDDKRGKWTGICLQYNHRSGFQTSIGEPEGLMLTALRYAIATAGPEERAAAEGELEQFGKSKTEKELRSFLMPERAEWFTEVRKQNYTRSRWWMLPCCARSLEDFKTAEQSVTASAFLLYTAVYVLGPAVAPLLAEELDSDSYHQRTGGRKQALTVLAALPTDEAFTILLDRLDGKYVRPAVVSAMRAFPVRAARLLAERASSSDHARRLLHIHLRSNPHLTVPDEVVALLAESAEAIMPEATADQLPALLASPPWLSRKKPVKPVVLADLPVPEAAVIWEPGEHEQWLASGAEWVQDHHDWRNLLKEYQAGLIGYYDNDLFLLAPEEEVRHLLADWKPVYSHGVEEWGKNIAARFGVDAAPALIRHVQSAAAGTGMVLLPFATVEVATQMADWFARTKAARRWGLDWLARHREQAVRLLIPAAAGKAGVPRRNAEAALRHLNNNLGVDVAAIAKECGAEAAIDVVLSVDPVDVLPAKLPAIGEWADTRLLPQVLLADRRHALSAEVAGHLQMTAALSKPGELYAGLPIAREALDPDSLAEFAWAVFQAWEQAGAPPKESWALSALGWFGDDDTVRRLSPLIRNWPGESQHARAVSGLDVLADIGTEVALSHLNSIAEKVSFKGLKTRAQEKVAQIAAELGLSRDQLSDRLVPRLGLDEAATLVIDYGSRRFTVGFDEQLKPFVLDPDGKRRKDLPKPSAKDDEDLAPLEHKRFMALKKDVRTIASDQIQRLERAMVDQREWSAEEFLTVLAAHPLLWHLVRRLVWITDEGTSFRLAEDRTLADEHDDEFTLSETATVRVAHAVELREASAAWGEVFADYEILQPFPQLGRPVHLLTSADDLLPRLKKYCDTPYPIGKILGLTKKGWVRGTPQDAGVECWITRPFPDGGALVARLEPGIAVGAMDVFPEVGFSDMWFSRNGHGAWSAPSDAPTTYEIAPITLSELFSELESLLP
ncbi:WGR domain-containing protein, predicted DNA-binding domain in MolR [Lentzea waywayandensis]|uniref:WGR domain-containing protein, predicted DNA-binding domain in MolR n=1 Tax=Lentzea waywayandensis TaxID=84724 RepID=A0A1I6CTG3_9PSEU|nr:DUF4132 domain-containing protein [Lentzea waywayandensis]SFQ96353.1 WGR domain-containing protein, predicted DNA-binding domain in MolR [Lentzea waywayandensis]